MSASPPSPAAQRLERIVTLITILTPLVAVGFAIAVFWRRGVEPRDLVLCAAMYLVTIAGITMGFHRLFTHKSFKCGAPLRFILGVAGSMASQGPLFFWVACHRRHHQHSDGEDDPHSPHSHGDGPWAVPIGWFHSHLGWMLVHKPENYVRLVNDLIRDRASTAVHRFYFLWVALGLVLPGLVAALWSGSWAAFWPGLLWGGLVRMFIAHHVTWSVNSVCHLFGDAPFATDDESRNNAIVAVLTLGEGWHNNHHAFPSSARHGLQWWEVDVTYALTLALRRAGLVWDVRLPEAHEVHRARRLPVSAH